MKGQILDFSVQSGEGLISAENGSRYRFKGAEWRDSVIPSRGLHVDFDVQGDQAVEVYRALGVRSQGASVSAGPKNRVTAGVLAILLGGIGIHKFYTGAWGWGIVYVVFCWAYIPAILGIIEGIRYLTLTDTDFERRAAQSRGPFAWLW